MFDLRRKEVEVRQFDGECLVIASHNDGKIKELKLAMQDHVPDILTARDLNLPAPVEDGLSFVENAELKARAGAMAVGHVVLADDSGLCVNALNGAPGIYAADWATRPDGSRDYAMAIQRIQDEIKDSQDRGAKFVCVISLGWPDGHCETVVGETKGTLVFPGRGDAGMGYDPIFVPEGETRTFGEIGIVSKLDLSPRYRALKKILARCFEEA